MKNESVTFAVDLEMTHFVAALCTFPLQKGWKIKSDMAQIFHSTLAFYSEVPIVGDSVHSCLILHSWDVFMDWQSRNRAQEDMCSKHIVVSRKDTDNSEKCAVPELHGPQFSVKTLCLTRERTTSARALLLFNDVKLNTVICHKIRNVHYRLLLGNDISSSCKLSFVSSSWFLKSFMMFCLEIYCDDAHPMLKSWPAWHTHTCSSEIKGKIRAVCGAWSGAVRPWFGCC